MAAEVSDARGVHLGCRSAQAEAHKEWSECMRKAAEEVGVRFFSARRLQAAHCAEWPALQAC